MIILMSKSNLCKSNVWKTKKWCYNVPTNQQINFIPIYLPERFFSIEKSLWFNEQLKDYFVTSIEVWETKNKTKKNENAIKKIIDIKRRNFELNRNWLID